MVQQMLISALYVMGFQGKNSTTLWYVELGASNHMTNTPTTLSHVFPMLANLPFKPPMAVLCQSLLLEMPLLHILMHLIYLCLRPLGLGPGLPTWPIFILNFLINYILSFNY